MVIAIAFAVLIIGFGLLTLAGVVLMRELCQIGGEVYGATTPAESPDTDLGPMPERMRREWRK